MAQPKINALKTSNSKLTANNKKVNSLFSNKLFRNIVIVAGILVVGAGALAYSLSSNQIKDANAARLTNQSLSQTLKSSDIIGVDKCSLNYLEIYSDKVIECTFSIKPGVSKIPNNLYVVVFSGNATELRISKQSVQGCLAIVPNSNKLVCTVSAEKSPNEKIPGRPGGTSPLLEGPANILIQGDSNFGPVYKTSNNPISLIKSGSPVLKSSDILSLDTCTPNTLEIDSTLVSECNFIIKPNITTIPSNLGIVVFSGNGSEFRFGKASKCLAIVPQISSDGKGKLVCTIIAEKSNLGFKALIEGPANIAIQGDSNFGPIYKTTNNPINLVSTNKNLLSKVQISQDCTTQKQVMGGGLGTFDCNFNVPFGLKADYDNGNFVASIENNFVSSDKCIITQTNEINYGDYIVPSSVNINCKNIRTDSINSVGKYNIVLTQNSPVLSSAVKGSVFVYLPL